MSEKRKSNARDPERREEILAAAREVFIEKGYTGATTAEIARRVSASKTTLYKAFGDKGALFEALLISRTSQVAAHMEPLKALADEMGPYEFLRLSAERILTITTRPDLIALFRIAVAETPQYPNLTRALLRARDHQGLTDYMASLDKKGVIRVDDPERATLMFISMTQGHWFHLMLINAMTEIPPEVVDVHARLTARMFLDAFAPRPD